MDELPQLINVLKGEMSIVGPRPPIPSEVGKYDNWQRRRLSMKPGLTCLWQVTPCRNDVCFEEWMNLDLHYIDTCPLVPLAASPSPSAIGCASGECRVGLAGGRACPSAIGFASGECRADNGRRVCVICGPFQLKAPVK
jgi:hypothetical protein